MNPGLFSRNYHAKGANNKKQASSAGRTKGGGSRSPRVPRGEAPKTNRSTARTIANESTPRSSPRTQQRDGENPRSTPVSSTSSLTPLPPSPHSNEEVKKNAASHENNVQNHTDVKDKVTETTASNGTSNVANNNVHIKGNDDKTNKTEKKQNHTQVNIPAAPKEGNNIGTNGVHDKKCNGDKKADSEDQQNPTESKKTKSKCSLQ